MKTLILTSSGFKNNLIPEIFENKLARKIKGTKILHITTASKVVKDGSYAERDTKTMQKLGFEVEEIDIAGKNKEEIEKALENKDAVYVQGGNGFYLLKISRESGFGEIIKEKVSSGKIIYIGKSAGTYLACPSLEMHTWTNKGWRRFGVTDLKTLNLIPFLIKAHYIEEKKEEVLKGIKETKYPVRILTDEQAFLIQDEKVTLIGKGEEIHF